MISPSAKDYNALRDKFPPIKSAPETAALQHPGQGITESMHRFQRALTVLKLNNVEINNNINYCSQSRRNLK